MLLLRHTPLSLGTYRRITVKIGSALLVIHLVLVARDYVAGRHELPVSIEAPVDEEEL